MVRQLAEWLAGRLHRAVLLAAVLVVVPLTSALSAAVVAMVTLDRGVRAGSIVAGGAAAIALALILAEGGDWALALGSLAIVFAPALAFAALLRRTGSLTLCLQVAVIAGLALVAGMFVLMDDPLAFWRTILDQWATLLEQAGGDSSWRQGIEVVAPLMPGIVVSSFVLLALTDVLLGRWLQAARSDGPGLGEEFRRLRLGYVIAGVTTIAVALAMLGAGPLVNNMVPVLLTGCLLQGLAILHAVKASRSLHTGWLVLAYVLLCLPTTARAATVALIGLGYVDNWYDVRARLKNPGA